MTPRAWAILIVALAVGCLAAPASWARQGDARLEPLFERLQSTRDEAEARVIEAGIWRVWFESGSDTVDLLMRTGNAAMASRDYGRAFELFSAAIEADPDYAEAWNRRATLLYAMGRHTESISDIEKVLALEPRHFGALSGLGLNFDAVDNARGALDAYRRALAVDPHLGHARERVKALALEVEGRKI